MWMKSEGLRATGGAQQPLSTIMDIKVEIIPFKGKMLIIDLLRAS